MFEIGTSTHAIAGFGQPGKPFRQSLAEMAECGFAHFMLLASEGGSPAGPMVDAQESLLDIRHSDIEAVVKAISSYGLRVSSLYPGFTLDYTPEGAAATVEKLKVYRDIAWRLGCHLMVHSAGRSLPPKTPLEEKKEHIRRVAVVMDMVASSSPGEVLKMAVDVHYGGIIETVADCEHLLSLAKKPNVGLCLNMGHMTTLGQEGWTLLLRYPERIHVIAWKDHLTGDHLPQPVVSCELGKGETPLQKYIEAYRQVECQASHLITFEDVPIAEKKDALKRSREYLVQLFQEN
ncbi:MAG: sugar phosphate isomerase/epimerase [Armatimonadetes bacterium]|nr:sugar phosphate isomerase/epimerase [Armatimonadota bacterium]